MVSVCVYLYSDLCYLWIGLKDYALVWQVFECSINEWTHSKDRCARGSAAVCRWINWVWVCKAIMASLLVLGVLCCDCNLCSVRWSVYSWLGIHWVLQFGNSHWAKRGWEWVEWLWFVGYISDMEWWRLSLSLGLNLDNLCLCSCLSRNSSLNLRGNALVNENRIRWEEIENMDICIEHNGI